MHKLRVVPVSVLLVLLSLLVANIASATQIELLGLFNKSAVVKVDGKLRKLAVGEQTPEGVRLVAADAQYAVFEHAGTEQHVPIGGAVRASYVVPERTPTPTALSAEIKPVDGLYRSAGSINGKSVTFVVDTGASWVSLNAGEANRLGIDYRVSGERRPVETAMGKTNAYVVMLERVAVGGVELENVEAAVLEGSSPSQALLGMSFLNRVNLKSSGQALVLERRL
jgi:aspartyl protease family protein